MHEGGVADPLIVHGPRGIAARGETRRQSVHAITPEAEIPQFTPTRFSDTGAGLTCGRSDPLPVRDDDRAPLRFAGRILRVVVDVEGQAFRDPDGDARVAITTQ